MMISSSSYYHHFVSPVFALIVIRHTAAFASPTIVAVALGDGSDNQNIIHRDRYDNEEICFCSEFEMISHYWNMAYLGVQTGTIDTTMSRRVEAVV